jgi:hypothetical protein
MGSFGTVQNRLFAGNRAGRGIYTASVGINDTDGDRAYSAYHSQDGSLGAEVQLTSIWNASLHGNYGHFLVQDPGTINPPYSKQNSASVGRGGLTADVGNATPALSGYTRFYSTWGHNAIADRSDTNNNFDSTDRITGGRLFQTWTPQPGRAQNALAMDFGGDFVNYGGAAENFNVSRTSVNLYGGQHQISDDAGFVRAHWSPSVKTLLNAGFRYQQNSQFGGIAVPERSGTRLASSRSRPAPAGDSATPPSESCISSLRPTQICFLSTNGATRPPCKHGSRRTWPRGPRSSTPTSQIRSSRWATIPT